MASLAVVWLRPPAYDRHLAVPADRRVDAGRHRPGEVLALLATGTTPTSQGMESALRPFWGRVWAPRVLVVPSDTQVPRAVIMGRLGIDALLGAGDLSPATLRLALTDESDFESGVVGRLEFHGYHLDDVCKAAIAALTRSGSAAAVEEILSLARVAKRTAERHLRASGLPTPVAWRSCSRVVRPVMALQRDPTLSIERAALDHGFADAAGLEHLAGRVIGRTTGYVRRELGWPPLLRLFLSKRSAPLLNSPDR
jgi:hypothetical protein